MGEGAGIAYPVGTHGPEDAGLFTGLIYPFLRSIEPAVDFAAEKVAVLAHVGDRNIGADVLDQRHLDDYGRILRIQLIWMDTHRHL